MSEQKHTHSGWRVGEVRHAGRYQLVEHAEASGFVCEVQAPLIEGKIDKAGREQIVRMIAAAPDLLAAARAALATHNCSTSEPGLPTLGEVEARLRAAIAKAEGRS